MAEYYGIYNYREYEPSYIALLTAGLREDSRTKMQIRGLDISTTELLLSGIYDCLRLILYSKTKDAEKGRNYPKLILDEIRKGKDADIQSFKSSEDFEEKRRKIMRC